MNISLCVLPRVRKASVLLNCVESVGLKFKAASKQPVVVLLDPAVEPIQVFINRDQPVRVYGCHAPAVRYFVFMATAGFQIVFIRNEIDLRTPHYALYTATADTIDQTPTVSTLVRSSWTLVPRCGTPPKKPLPHAVKQRRLIQLQGLYKELRKAKKRSSNDHEEIEPPAPPKQPRLTITFNDLPIEMLRHVASFLDHKSAISFRCVNSQCRAIAETLPLFSVTMREHKQHQTELPPAGPAGVYHLTVKSWSNQPVNATLSAVRSMSVAKSGVFSLPLKEKLTKSRNLRRLDLIESSAYLGVYNGLPEETPGFDQNEWMPEISKALSQHPYLCELHIVERLSAMTPLVATLSKQLRVLTVPTSQMVTGISFPVLEKLTICSELTIMGRNIRHQKHDAPGKCLKLRVITAHCGDDKFTKYDMHTTNALLEEEKLVAPRLHTLTIVYATGGGRLNYWYALPGGLPYRQVTNLTLANALFNTWVDLFLIPLPNVEQLTLLDTRVRNARVSPQTCPGLEHVTRPAIYAISLPTVPQAWYVAPKLKRLTVDQRQIGLVPFVPMTKYMPLVVHDAFPKLERLDIVDTLINNPKNTLCSASPGKPDLKSLVGVMHQRLFCHGGHWYTVSHSLYHVVQPEVHCVMQDLSLPVSVRQNPTFQVKPMTTDLCRNCRDLGGNPSIGKSSIDSRTWPEDE